MRIEDVAALRPVPLDWPPEVTARLLGTQFQLWTEYIPDSRALDYMTFPRACAFAEVASSGEPAPWSGGDERCPPLQRPRGGPTRPPCRDWSRIPAPERTPTKAAGAGVASARCATFARPDGKPRIPCRVPYPPRTPRSGSGRTRTLSGMSFAIASSTSSCFKSSDVALCNRAASSAGRVSTSRARAMTTSSSVLLSPTWPAAFRGGPTR